MKEIKDTERLSCKLTSHTMSSLKNESFDKSTLKLLNSDIEPVLTVPEEKSNGFCCKAVFSLLILAIIGATATAIVKYQDDLSTYYDYARLYFIWRDAREHL